MTEERVRVDVRDGIATVTLDNPATRNGMSPAMVAGLSEAFVRAEAEARVVVLQAAGRVFCSGVDLSDPSADPSDTSGGNVLEDHYNPMLMRIRALKVPLVVKIAGPAAGVGAALALAGDIICAGESAAFVHAFRRVGLVPDGGAAYLLTRAIGRVRAMELMLLGERLSAATALQWGLVTRVVPDDALDALVDTIARDLARGPTVALSGTRRMGWLALDATLEEELAHEVSFQAEASASADFREGVRAFVERRPPDFTGW